MNDKNPRIELIKVSMFLVTTALISFTALSIIFYFFYANGHMNNKPAFTLSILLVASLITLIVSLSMMAVVYKYLGLDDRTQTLGLPPGSMQAVIALSLILIFMISCILLYEEVATVTTQITYATGLTQEMVNYLPKDEIISINQSGFSNNETLYNVQLMITDPENQDSIDIAKQIITTVSTLVVAVAGFYFGSKSVSERSAAQSEKGAESEKDTGDSQ